MNKQPLEQRIVSILANANAGSESLAELIEEVETAARACVETAEAERTKSLDLVQCPDPRQARERVAAAELAGDRLSTQLPKLRDRYTAALATERRDRWESDFKKVEEAANKLRQEYKDIDQAYRSAKAERDKLIGRMQDCDLDVERVNDAARELGIWDRQLEPLLEPMQPERKWGAPRISNGGLAVALAQSMVPPTYNPADWSKPEVQAQRRAEAEKRQREMGAYYEQAGKDQEQRQNAEERARFLQHRTP
jgi:hypothetical protein